MLDLAAGRLRYYMHGASGGEHEEHFRKLLIVVDVVDVESGYMGGLSILIITFIPPLVYEVASDTVSR